MEDVGESAHSSDSTFGSRRESLDCSRIVTQVEVPVDCEIEHMFEQSQLAVYRRAGYLFAPVKFVAFDIGRRDIC